MKVCISVFFTVFFLSISALQAKNTIQRVELSRDNFNRPTVNLFLANTNPVIITLSDSIGKILLILPDVDFESDLKTENLNNDFVRKIQLLGRNSDETIISIDVASLDFNVEQGVEVTQKDSIIEIALNYSGSQPAQAPLPSEINIPDDGVNPAGNNENQGSDSVDTEQIPEASSPAKIHTRGDSGSLKDSLLQISPENDAQDNEGTQPVAMDSLGKAEVDLGGLVTKSLIFLLVLLILLYLVNKFINSKGLKNTVLRRKNPHVRVISNKTLSRNHSVMILNINGKRFACGVTKSNINFLIDVPEQMNEELENLSNRNELTVPALRTLFLRRKRELSKKVAPPAKIQNNYVPQKKGFRDVLYGKLRNLKRLD